MKIQTKSLSDTEKIAKIFADTITKDGLFCTLTGDIGAGKTQFIRYVLGFLNVKEQVTSPSFVILNEYKTAKFPIYHFDLYRLEQKGIKSIISELREYSKKGVVTFIEWAEFALNEIPKNSLRINVEYDENNLDIRLYEFSGDRMLFLDNFTKRIKDDKYLSNLLCAE